MAVSKLATKYKFENFGAVRWNSRGGQKITTIVVHHAATTNFDIMPGCWANVEASAHYGIGPNGEIRAYIDEEKRAWHGNNANSYSIGVELTNIKGAPNWEVSEASITALVKLIQEIQSRRGKLQIIGHRDCPGANTVCPGPFLYGRLSSIRSRVNSGSSSPVPSTPADPCAAGQNFPVQKDGNKSTGHVDRFGPKGDNLWVNGWQIGNYAHQFIFIMDRRTGKELARLKAPGISRPDVNAAYKTSGKVGYDVNFKLSQFKGKQVYAMMRCTNDSKGDTAGGTSDIHWKNWYHDIK